MNIDLSIQYDKSKFYTTNIYFIRVIFEVTKFDMFNDVNDMTLIYIYLILETFVELKFNKLKEVND